MWVSFVPDVASQGWTLDKIGLPVRPHNVVAGGTRYLHAVDAGASWSAANESLVIESYDACANVFWRHALTCDADWTRQWCHPQEQPTC